MLPPKPRESIPDLESEDERAPIASVEHEKRPSTPAVGSIAAERSSRTIPLEDSTRPFPQALLATFLLANFRPKLLASLRSSHPSLGRALLFGIAAFTLGTFFRVAHMVRNLHEYDDWLDSLPNKDAELLEPFFSIQALWARVALAPLVALALFFGVALLLRFGTFLLRIRIPYSELVRRLAYGFGFYPLFQGVVVLLHGQALGQAIFSLLFSSFVLLQWLGGIALYAKVGRWRVLLALYAGILMPLGFAVFGLLLSAVG